MLGNTQLQDPDVKELHPLPPPPSPLPTFFTHGFALTSPLGTLFASPEDPPSHPGLLPVSQTSLGCSHFLTAVPEFSSASSLFPRPNFPLRPLWELL